MCHDENKRGVGIITLEVQVVGMQIHGKSGFTSSTDNSKNNYLCFSL